MLQKLFAQLRLTKLNLLLSRENPIFCKGENKQLNLALKTCCGVSDIFGPTLQFVTYNFSLQLTGDFERGDGKIIVRVDNNDKN